MTTNKMTQQPTVTQLFVFVTKFVADIKIIEADDGYEGLKVNGFLWLTVDAKFNGESTDTPDGARRAHLRQMERAFFDNAVNPRGELREGVVDALNASGYFVTEEILPGQKELTSVTHTKRGWLVLDTF